jgi:hypothetical protein
MSYKQVLFSLLHMMSTQQLEAYLYNMPRAALLEWITSLLSVFIRSIDLDLFPEVSYPFFCFFLPFRLYNIF